MLNGLDLFSGIGGISLALREWIRPVAYCEIEAYCQAVLLSRMATGDLVLAPIWDDIKTLRIRPQEVDIDIIYGGFPCQDISVAGLGKGLEGERSGLFFEIVRLSKEIQPTFIFLENVPAITSRGGLQVIRDITEMGYDCRWCVISAQSVGALHRRERWFMLAHAKHAGASTSENGGSLGECTSQREESRQSEESVREAQRTSGISSYVARSNLENGSNSMRESGGEADTYPESEQAEGGTRRRSSGQHWPFESRDDWQEIVSSMGKSSHGIPHHVDRLRALGNSVCPQQTKEAFKILMGLR